MASVPLIHCEILQAVEDAWTINLFVICLDRPDLELNILDLEFGHQLGRALYLAREKVTAGEVDMLVVCSAKLNSFMAGADILTQLKLTGIEGEQRAYSYVRNLQAVFCALECLPIPTVAVLNGITLGGGLELALSCDFRIADTTACKQLGLPEVKLGVLPGAGGCVRLPRLIGFRRSLELLVTGQTISGEKALKMGIVDHLIPNTQTLQQSGTSYEYQWLSDLLACVEDQEIGTKPFPVAVREGMTAVGSIVDVSQLAGVITEEMMFLSITENWKECEKKAEQKYPQRKGGYLWFFLDFFLHALVYSFTLLQLLRKVGLKMTAPYACLHTTFRCLYAGSWLEAMATNAHGIALLIVSCEAKGLMSLFLLTRKLKKLALTFGLKSSEDGAKLSTSDFSVVVYVSGDMLSLSAPFVQSLLYNGIATKVVITDNTKPLSISTKIRNQFEYAIGRKHIKGHEVDAKMQLLSISTSEVKESIESNDSSFIVVSASSVSFSVEEIVRNSNKVISVSLSPNSVPCPASPPILMNMGDPVRKNTVAVEITPMTSQCCAEDLRQVSSLVAAVGKIPVLTPSSSLTSCELHLLLSHWSLAVSLVSVYGKTVNPKMVDKALVSAGYSMGPFQAMQKHGKLYLKECSNESLYLNRLRKYINTSTVPLPLGGKKHLSLTRSQIADLFTLNLVLSALYVRQVTYASSEAAIDTICVAGLTHFPPTEAGPLNYASRVGKETIISMYDEYTKAVPFVAEVGGAKHPLQLLSSIDDLFGVKSIAEGSGVKSIAEGSGALVEAFKEQNSNLVLLSKNELVKVGGSYGMKNKEVFTLSLGTASFLVLTLWIVLVSLIVFFV